MSCCCIIFIRSGCPVCHLTAKSPRDVYYAAAGLFGASYLAVTVRITANPRSPRQGEDAYCFPARPAPLPSPLSSFLLPPASLASLPRLAYVISPAQGKLHNRLVMQNRNTCL